LPDPHENQEAHRELHAEPGVSHPRAPLLRFRDFHGANLPACEIFRKQILLRWSTIC
jgi:hypothetical protein